MAKQDVTSRSLIETCPTNLTTCKAGQDTGVYGAGVHTVTDA